MLLASDAFVGNHAAQKCGGDRSVVVSLAIGAAVMLPTDLVAAIGDNA